SAEKSKVRVTPGLADQQFQKRRLRQVQTVMIGLGKFVKPDFEQQLAAVHEAEGVDDLMRDLQNPLQQTKLIENLYCRGLKKVAAEFPVQTLMPFDQHGAHTAARQQIPEHTASGAGPHNRHIDLESLLLRSGSFLIHVQASLY